MNTLLLATTGLLCTAALAADWTADFAAQPLGKRPQLETRYLDPARTWAETRGETYVLTMRFVGESGHLATVTADPWEEPMDLWVEVETDDGGLYTSRGATAPSRINLYRRGPYYHEVHWFDVQCVSAAGEALPAKGEVVFHCYPEKLHVAVILHAVGDIGPGRVRIATSPGFQGRIAGQDRAQEWFEGLSEGKKVSAYTAMAWPADPNYPVEVAPPADSQTLELLEGVEATYDPIRGSYMLTSDNPGGFNYHFYENQNHYETVRFRLSNDATPRKVYICHATRQSPGSVECGAILDESGHMLPVMIQISKNFAGEKEEPFYNPTDIPFSETFYPLYMGAGETREITSLHLYQNWGNHPLKQFSSLGAWMDYYHSSTGVTETTCFVPFKFGGLGGVDIADYRPMSQRMWDSQPQHDNIAGHRFLMYQTGGKWHYAKYEGTTFRSTGPNWMDVGLQYTSEDGAMRVQVDSFELPQTDELRNFIHLRIDVLKPVAIDSLGTDFRLLDITSRIQALRYKHTAWQPAEGELAVRELKAEDAVPVAGEPLGGPFPWATVYGEKKGCNAYVLQSFEAHLGGQDRQPAVMVQTHKSGDMNLALTVQGGAAQLRPGDYVDARFYLLPYGDDRNTYETPQADRVCYGVRAPQVTAVTHGEKLADFPTRLRAAQDGTARFALFGGLNYLPIIVEGLKDFRDPELQVKDGDTWRPVEHSKLGKDGYQVFVAEDGSFGCVFLVNTNGTEREYRLQAGGAAVPQGDT